VVEYHYGGDPTVADVKRVVNLQQAIAYLTLQDALAASANADELVAYPGIYEERIFFQARTSCSGAQIRLTRMWLLRP